MLVYLLFFNQTKATTQQNEISDILVAVADVLIKKNTELPPHLKNFMALLANNKQIPEDILDLALIETNKKIQSLINDNKDASEDSLNELERFYTIDNSGTISPDQQLSALDLFYTTSTVLAATNLNVPNCIVQRNHLGNFSANIISAQLRGNVVGNVTGTASVALSFGGVSANNVLTSSTPNSIALRDVSGNLSANTFTGNLAGNVVGNLTGTADTAIYASRAGSASNINGVSASSIINCMNTVLTATAARRPNCLVLRDKNSDLFARELNLVSALSMTSSAACIYLKNKPLLHAIGDKDLSNIFIGVNAGSSTLTSSKNTAIGSGALQSNQNGFNNIALGCASGSKLVSGNNNIYCGNLGSSLESGVIRLGTNTTHTACFIAGITNGLIAKKSSSMFVDSAGRVGTVVSSKRFKKNIADLPDKEAELNGLRPVSFNYISEPESDLQYGLIAEEVHKVMPELVIYNDKNEIQSVAYQYLPILLLQQYQKQSKLIKELQAEMSRLKSVQH